MLASLYATGIKVAEFCRLVEFSDKNKLSATTMFRAIYEMFKERKLIKEEQRISFSFIRIIFILLFFGRCFQNGKSSFDEDPITRMEYRAR